MLLQGWRLFATAILLVWTVGVMSPNAVWGELTNPELAKALAYFEQGDYSRASSELARLVDDPTLTAAERVRVREALGISHYVLGRLLDARRDFNQLLRESPEYQPDSLFVPPEIVAFILELKSSQPPAATTAETVPVVVSLPPVATAPPPPKLVTTGSPELFSSLDLLPFGAAQFRKNHTGRGIALVTLQGLLLGTNIGLYYYRRCELKDSCSDPYYDAGSISKAQHLQTYQMVTGALFVGTALLGIADGFLLPINESSTISLTPVGSGVGFAWKVD